MDQTLKCIQIIVLERVWRKGNPPSPLIGMQIGAVTVENSIEVLQKTENRATI